MRGGVFVNMRFNKNHIKFVQSVNSARKRITAELKAWGGLLRPVVYTTFQGLRTIFERKTTLGEKTRRLGDVWRNAG